MSESVGNMRRVTVNAFTEAGWVAGSVHIPGQIKLADYLNRASDFLALTEVFMEAQAVEIPFFALRRGAIHLLTSGELDEPQVPDGMIPLEEHNISCILSLGRLKGIIRTKPGIRLSDILAKQKTFVAIANCTYEIRSPQTRKINREEHSLILVNCGSIIGLSE